MQHIKICKLFICTICLCFFQISQLINKTFFTPFFYEAFFKTSASQKKCQNNNTRLTCVKIFSAIVVLKIFSKSFAKTVFFNRKTYFTHCISPTECSITHKYLLPLTNNHIFQILHQLLV